MMKYPFLDLQAATEPLVPELQRAAGEVIAGGRYLLGEQTRELEREIAALCETKHCVAVSNGLDALRLILRAYVEMGRLHHGDKVFVPANTYVASVLAVTDAGLEPVLVEPDPSTMNLDSTMVREALGGNVKAVMLVHLYGSPAWSMGMKELSSDKKDLLVIEDNAQAIGARTMYAGLNGTHTTGGLGHAGACSFYPTKNLGALGDAGAVTTNDDELAATVRALANYGSDRRYHNIYAGFNCRIDEVQAAMLRVKLHHLDEETARRRDVAEAYNATIRNRWIKRPLIDPYNTQVWHQYVVRAWGCRDQFRDYLAAHGVGTDVHYAVPPYRQPCYAERYPDPWKFMITEDICDSVVSLPIAAPITPDDAVAIGNIINDFKP